MHTHIYIHLHICVRFLPPFYRFLKDNPRHSYVALLTSVGDRALISALDIFELTS